MKSSSDSGKDRIFIWAAAEKRSLRKLGERERQINYRNYRGLSWFHI